jgi:hypothetical protein
MEENLNFPQPPYDNYNSESFLHVKFVVPHSGAASQFLTVGGHSLASLGGGTSTVLQCILIITPFFLALCSS